MVRGGPTDAELAALTVVLAAAASAGTEPAATIRDRWSDPAVQLRTRLAPGPGAWRTTYGMLDARFDAEQLLDLLYPDVN